MTYGRKKFYNIGPWGHSSKTFSFFVSYEWAKQARVFVTDKPLVNSLLFASKARADLSRARRVGSGLTSKRWNRLERPAGTNTLAYFPSS